MALLNKFMILKPTNPKPKPKPKKTKKLNKNQPNKTQTNKKKQWFQGFRWVFKGF
jgi:hypothetical protein